MDLADLGNHQVHDFARFHAAAAALAYGYRAARIEGASTRIIVDERTIHVSAQGACGDRPGRCPLGQPVAKDAVAMIFVDLTGTAPDFYIARASGSVMTSGGVSSRGCGASAECGRGILTATTRRLS